MNSIIVATREAQAVHTVLESIDSELASEFHGIASWKVEIQNSQGQIQREGLELTCSDDLLERVWSTLSVAQAEVTKESEFDGFTLPVLIDCLESWMILWSDKEKARNSEEQESNPDTVAIKTPAH